MARHRKTAALIILALAAAGCLKRAAVKSPGDPGAGLHIRWYGHSCFTISDSADRVFLIDPFNDTVGYDRTWPKPDAALVTHDHFDHNGVDPMGQYLVLSGSGTHTLAGVEVTGILADHDAEKGRRNGHTTLYVWEMGGLRLAHLGDIAQAELTPAQKTALSSVHVMFVPVGGKTTWDGARAAELVKSLGPRIIVPMHYATKNVRFFEFDPVDKFLAFFDNVVKMPAPDFQVRLSSLPKPLTVYVPAAPDPSP